MKSEIDIIMHEVEESLKPHILVNLISKRVRQLLRGDKPLVETRHMKDPLQIAFKEYYLGKLRIVESDEVIEEEIENSEETAEV